MLDQECGRVRVLGTGPLIYGPGFLFNMLAFAGLFCRTTCLIIRDGYYVNSSLFSLYCSFVLVLLILNRNKYCGLGKKEPN